MPHPNTSNNYRVTNDAPPLIYKNNFFGSSNNTMNQLSNVNSENNKIKVIKVNLGKSIVNKSEFKLSKY